MLGIRLSPEAEQRLERHARDTGRPKSVIARDWIMDRLEREEVDELMRNAARVHRAAENEADVAARGRSSAAYLRWLEEEDGGYNWGPEGPPEPR
jgi:predicted DNA-binding protein